MKMTTLFAALALASVATAGFAQQKESENDRRPERRGGFLAQARTDDGKIDLSKLPENLPQDRKDAAKAADKDGDGFLSQDEFRAFAPRRDGGDRPGRGGDADRGPGRGGDRPGPGGDADRGPGFGGAFKDGKIELAKLPENMPQERKDAFKAADKDGDGFLTFDEAREIAPKFPEGKRPDFFAEDGKIDVAKLTEAIKSVDKNNDGFIDRDEKKAAFDAAREKFGPGCFFFFTQHPAPPQFGFGGPQGGPEGRAKGQAGDRSKNDRSKNDRSKKDR